MLSFYLFVFSSFCIFLISLYLSTMLFVYKSFSVFLITVSVYVLVSLSFFPYFLISVYLSTCLSVYLSFDIFLISGNQFTWFLYLPICICFIPSVYLSTFLSISLSVSACFILCIFFNLVFLLCLHLFGESSLYNFIDASSIFPYLLNHCLYIYLSAISYLSIRLSLSPSSYQHFPFSSEAEFYGNPV